MNARCAHLPGSFHVVFTTHRDARDALLALAQTGDGDGNGRGTNEAGCTPTLLDAFREYARFAPHACRDMRYEDLVHGGHGAQARRARALPTCTACLHAVYTQCMQCARSVHAR